MNNDKSLIMWKMNMPTRELERACLALGALNEALFSEEATRRSGVLLAADVAVDVSGGFQESVLRGAFDAAAIGEGNAARRAVDVFRAFVSLAHIDATGDGLPSIDGVLVLYERATLLSRGRDGLDNETKTALTDALTSWLDECHGFLVDPPVARTVKAVDSWMRCAPLDQEDIVLMARLLTPLLLWKWRVLSQPLLKVGRLYDEDGDVAPAVTALRAMAKGAEDTLDRVHSLDRRHKDFLDRLPPHTAKSHLPAVVDWLFERPVFQINDLMDAHGVADSTARELIRKLEGVGVVRSCHRGRGYKEWSAFRLF